MKVLEGRIVGEGAREKKGDEDMEERRGKREGKGRREAVRGRAPLES